MKKAKVLALAIAVFAMLCSCTTVGRLRPVPLGESGLSIEWINELAVKETYVDLTADARMLLYGAKASDRDYDVNLLIHYSLFPEDVKEKTGWTAWDYACVLQADGVYDEFIAAYEPGFFNYKGLNAKTIYNEYFNKEKGSPFNLCRVEIGMKGIYGTSGADAKLVILRSDILELGNGFVYLSITYRGADGMRAANAIEKDFLSRYLGPEVMSLGLWDDYPF